MVHYYGIVNTGEWRQLEGDMNIMNIMNIINW